jgi:hypothetical protein
MSVVTRLAIAAWAPPLLGDPLQGGSMRRLVPLLVPLAALASPRTAVAAPCTDLPNPVFIQMGDTQVNLMKRVGRALRDNPVNPITVVFITSGSCTNIDAIHNRVPITTNMQYIPSIAEDAAWTPTSPTIACQPPAGGVVPDIANSNVFNSACTQATPATVRVSNGPVQAYVMAVPEASSQKAITFEEAYFVFGFGMAGMISPWVDETNMFIRTITKSTLLTWAANISVPGDVWKGVRRDASSMVVADLIGSPNPESAIGILGVEVYDGLRDKLNVLAYRGKGQYAAYFPDSTFESRDKKNVRDGHYTVWSPTIWMETLNGAGQPVNQRAHYVVDLLTGKAVTPEPQFPNNQTMIDFIAAVGLVPDCAMQVQRSFEGGPLTRYRSSASCICAYESRVDQSSCETCPTGTCNNGGVCRAGFCEVQ